MSYFIEKGIKDIELLLTIWSAYISNYEKLYDVSNAVTRRGNYEKYIKNLCYHLAGYADEAKKTESYNKFKEWLKDKTDHIEISFITLNYDLVLENIISDIGKNIVYLDAGQKDNNIFIRKLHGSVNWVESKSNSPFKDSENNNKEISSLLWKDKDQDIFIQNLLHPYKMPYDVTGNPVLIPPIVNKEYTAIFKSLLCHAKKDLDNATYVIIIGYSFPESDIVIRDLIKNHPSKDKWSKFYYINPDKNSCDIVKELLGTKLNTIEKEWDIELFTKEIIID